MTLYFLLSDEERRRVNEHTDIRNCDVMELTVQECYDLFPEIIVKEYNDDKGLAVFRELLSREREKQKGS